jgi:hypothetical protein
LLFIGIHNAFDVAVSVTAQKQKDKNQQAHPVPKRTENTNPEAY